MKEIVVVGGGLADVASAITAARSGARVTLIERAPELGGRATTSTRAGFLFNIGPHALYGPAEAILRALGVRLSGGHPSLAGTIAMRDHERHTLAIGTSAMLSTSLLEETARDEAAALFERMSVLDTAPLQQVTIEAWLARATASASVRALVSTFLRVSSYANASDIGSAGAHLDHLRATQAGGVRYVDGGWQTIVDELHTLAVTAGVRFVPSARVICVLPTGSRWSVIAASTKLDADAVIAAVGPREASKLVPTSTMLASAAERAIPVEAATLDVALARVPFPATTYGLGVDRPLYFSLHSAAARLAPGAGGVFHAAMYLPVTSRAPSAAIVDELESFVDALQPGWRDHVVHRRVLPHIMVANAHVTAADGGLPGRPPPAVPDAPGLYVAGDWVGDTGMLAQAALASAVEAGRLAATGAGEDEVPLARSAS